MFGQDADCVSTANTTDTSVASTATAGQQCSIHSAQEELAEPSQNRATHWRTRQSNRFAQTANARLAALAVEVERLKALAAELSHQNAVLRNRVDIHCQSPSEKRMLLEYITTKHGVSRLRACRLVSLSRSTCWYRSASDETLAVKRAELFESLPKQSLIRRVEMVAEQLDRGIAPRDQLTVSLVEFALNDIGLPRAARMVSTNLKLALETFSEWSKMHGVSP